MGNQGISGDYVGLGPKKVENHWTLDTDNVCHHMTKMDHPPREMKETLFTRHTQTVLPLLDNTKNKSLSWRSGKRPRLRARRVKVRFSLRAIILSLENLNVIIRAIN